MFEVINKGVKFKVDLLGIKSPDSNGYGYTRVVKYTTEETTITDSRSWGQACCVMPYATGNCQWGTICKANQLFSIFDNESVLKILQELQKVCMKPMWLLDVQNNSELLDRINQIYPTNKVLMRTPYSSTNGSSMILMLVKNNGLLA